MIRLQVPQLRPSPMAKHARRLLCHCLRVGVVLLLRPLSPAANGRMLEQVQERESRTKQSIVLAGRPDTDARGAGASEGRQAAIRPAGTSGAYHVKSMAVLAHWLMLGHSLAPPPAPHRRAAAYSHALI